VHTSVRAINEPSVYSRSPFVPPIPDETASSVLQPEPSNYKQFLSADFTRQLA